jgi:hypothetical protein
MEFYLTENIILKDNRTYYKEKGKIKRINRNNWHHYLKDFGWYKMPLQWIKILNKLSENKNIKNSSFAVLDCSSDGDCFFHCISNSLNEYNRVNENYELINSVDVRNKIADSITNEIFNEIIGYYRIMKDVDDFDEEWDPYEIKDLKSFKDIIKEGGHSYWCDYILLNEITKIFRINIFILNSNENNSDYSPYNTLIDYNHEYDTIFLLYEDNCHFKLIGYFDGSSIISYFTENIPIEFLKLFKLR